MKSYKILDISGIESEKIISYLKSKPFVILFGSAISLYKPTCLITGQYFTNELFNLLFPKSIFKSDNKLKKLLKDFFSHVPFEHLLERCPNQYKIKKIIKEHFLVDRFNILHKILADSFLNNNISNIITTNYDICLDKLLKFSKNSNTSLLNNSFTRIINKNDFNKFPNKRTKCYFKIHGSSDDLDGESLVFSLTHESLLPEWKFKALKNILNSNTLLIVGYSGKDFEICPELMKIHLKETIWICRNRNKLSYNAKQILNRDNSVLLEGDMLELFKKLFNLRNIPKQPQNNYELIEKIKSKFSDIEIIQWRTTLLNSIGIPKLAYSSAKQLMNICCSTNNVNYSSIIAERQLAQALFHIGKYRSSSNLFLKSGEHARQIGDHYLQVGLISDACNSFVTYGAFIKTILYTIISKKIIKTLNIENKQKNRLLSEIYLRNLRILEKIIKMLPFKLINPFYYLFRRFK